MGMLIMRLLLGVIFFLQGYGKIFDIGVEELHEFAFARDFKDILPVWTTKLTAYYTSYVELIAGLMLILGLFRDWALYFLASVLIIVSIGHGIVNPFWPLSDVAFRAMLLIPLLLLPATWDTIRLDTIIARRNAS